MPYRSHIDVGRRVAFVELHGIVTYAEIESYFRQLAASEEFEPTFSQFVLADVSMRTGLSHSEMERLKTIDPFAASSCRIIVAPTDFIFGLARMYQTVLDSDSLSIVRTQMDGLKLLDKVSGPNDDAQSHSH